MGNSASRERRRQESGAPDSAYGSRQGSLQPDGGDNQAHGGRSGRGSRHDVSIFNLGGPPQDGPEVRRETKPEREARRLERERVIRAKERERSMREEHVDGGYLVTQGVYTGPEDFNRGIVRQFMVGLC